MSDINEDKLHRLERKTALAVVIALILGIFTAFVLIEGTVAGIPPFNPPDRPSWVPPDTPRGPPFEPPPTQDLIPVIIGFRNLPDADIVRQHGGEVRREFSIIPAIAARLPGAMVEKLRTNPKVAYVEPDAIAYTMEETTPWGISKINSPSVWSSYNNKGTGIKVAILDTGIQYNHPDLKANIKGGINYAYDAPDRSTIYLFWTDKNGHGTHVAGIVAAVDNDIGVIGVAPEAYLYAVKVLSRWGDGYYSDVVQGVEWAANENMQIISMSLGGTYDSQALHDAIDAARAKGIIVVAAAGNSGDGNPTTNNMIYPAKYSSVISVGATNQDDGQPTWSSDGAELDVSAPGVGIYSTYLTSKGGYATLSGTSMATPHATGTIALMLKAGIQPNDIQAKLQNTAVDIRNPGYDVFSGYGRIDALGAVS